MTRTARVAAALNIQPGEGHLVRLVLGYGFALGMGRALCATAISGLFLSMFGAQAMPFVFIGTALVVPFTGIGYLRLQRQVSLMRLIAITLIGLACALLVLRGILGYSTSPWVVLPAMIGYTILYVLITLAFWGLSGQIFNLRQAKRLFGLLGSGSELADIVGGLLTIVLAPWIGSLNLLFLAAIGLCSGLLVQRRIIQVHAQSQPTIAVEQNEPPVALPTLFGNRYVRLIMALIVFSQLGYFFVENIFYDLSMAHFSGPEQFSGLVGGTIAATSIATILLQVTVAGRLASRYGIRVTQLVLPCAVLLGALAVAISGTALGGAFIVFAVMLITRVLERALRFSVEESSIQIAYQPLPANQRSLAQTIVAGGVRPLTAGIAGVLILVTTRLLGFGGVELAYLLVLICIGWIVIAVLTGRAYPQALMAAMSQRRLSGATIDLADPTSVAIIERGLHSPYPGEALYALTILEEQHSAQLTPALRHLLYHPEPSIRGIALERIEQYMLSELGDLVAERTSQEPDAAIRGQAIQTLAMLAHPLALQYAQAALMSEIPQVQLGGAVALARVGNTAEFRVWLSGHATAHAADQRILAAQAIGAVGDSAWDSWLPTLLNDPDSAVRHAALLAIPTLNTAGLWLKAIDALVDSSVQTVAAQALIAGGSAAFPFLQAAFEHPSSPHALRVAIIRLAGRDPAFTPIAVSAVDSIDLEIRQLALHALVRNSFSASGSEVARIEQQVHAEADFACWLLAAKRDLGDDMRVNMLQQALDHSIDACRSRILDLLSMYIDADSIRQVQINLQHGSGEQRAYAIETLDLLLSPALRTQVLPLFEAANTHKIPAIPQQTSEEWLAALGDTTNPNLHPWIRMCTQYALQSYDATPANGSTQIFPIVERVQLLQHMPIFSAVPVEELMLVAQAMQTQHYLAGDAIVHKGDLGDSVFLVVHGTVRVHDGELTLNTLGAHDIFGETAVLDAQPRIATVTAVENCELLRLDSATLHGLIGSHVAVAHGIIRVLIRYVRENMREISSRDSQLQLLS